MSNIKAIAEKIRALRAKAENAASSESEALEAAAMVAKLLTKFDLSEEDLRDYQGENKTSAVAGAYDYHIALHACWKPLCELTETKAFRDHSGDINFIGMPHDVELALYLSIVIVGAADRSWLKVRGALGNTTHNRKSYMAGFSMRMRERIRELAEDRRKAKTATGTQIVVCKGELIEQFEREAGLSLSSARKTRGYAVNQTAFAAGRTVANGVNLSRPLAGAAKSAHIS